MVKSGKKHLGHIRAHPNPGIEDDPETSANDCHQSAYSWTCEGNNNYEISEWTGDVEEDAERPAQTVQIRKIFVGNLNERTAPYDLRNFFRRFGKVVDAHITRDKQTGSRRNYGFITFMSPCDAARVLQTPSCELRLHSRDLRVAAADPWHQPEVRPDGRIVLTRKYQKLVDGPNKSEKYICWKLMAARALSEKEVNEKKCRIHILNDDCLTYIFSFLSKRERIRIERVCKRWQEVSKNMWKSQRHVDFENMFSSAEGVYPSVNILRCLLERCGPNLASLDLSYKPNNFNGRVLSVVSKLVPNLRCLNLSSLPLVSHSLRRLSEVSRNLQRLNLESCSGVIDRDLRSLFEHCPNLEALVLSRNNQITGKCLVGLSGAKLCELVLDDCNNLRSRFLATGLNKLKFLTHLSLNSCINLTSSDIMEILRSLTRLKYLSIGRYFPLVSSSALCSLQHLQDLVSLNLQHNPAVNDHVITVIATHCLKLEKLNVTGCTVQNVSGESGGTLTNKGFRAIAQLPNLIDLSMSYLAVVTDEALDTVADRGRLKRLECRGCPTFTDAGCMRVVALCGDLEHFDFCGCDHVTDETVKTALEAVKERSNNVKLRIVVGGTKVSKAQVTHPLLIVDLADYCLAHMRPDFVDNVYFDTDNEDDDDDDNDDENEAYFGALGELAYDSQSGCSSDIDWDHDSCFSYDELECIGADVED